MRSKPGTRTCTRSIVSIWGRRRSTCSSASARSSNGASAPRSPAGRSLRHMPRCSARQLAATAMPAATSTSSSYALPALRATTPHGASSWNCSPTTCTPGRETTSGSRRSRRRRCPAPTQWPARRRRIAPRRDHPRRTLAGRAVRSDGMTTRGGRTQPCDRVQARTRLDNAQKSLEVAELAAGEQRSRPRAALPRLSQS